MSKKSKQEAPQRKEEGKDDVLVNFDSWKRLPPSTRKLVGDMGKEVNNLFFQFAPPEKVVLTIEQYIGKIKASLEVDGDPRTRTFSVSE